MENLTLNLYDFIDRYKCNTRAQTGYDKLQELIDNGEENKLRTLLRDHHVKSITDQDELDFREDVDSLFQFYSLLEIACIIQFVPDSKEFPEDFRKETLFILDQSIIKPYYFKHYPILLSQNLLNRIQHPKKRENTYQPKKVYPLFNQFLLLNKTIEEDAQVEAFLWFLDGGRYGDYNIADLWKILNNAQQIKKRLETHPDDQDGLDHVFYGYFKFLGFIYDFDLLLQRTNSFPEIQSAFWFYHSYWFGEMKKELKEVMDKTYDLAEGIINEYQKVNSQFNIWSNLKELSNEETESINKDIVSESYASIDNFKIRINRVLNANYKNITVYEDIFA